MSDLESAGVRIDVRENVDDEREEQQKWVKDGHALQQEDGCGLGLVFAQHEERRDVAGQAEDTDKTDDDCTHDKAIKLTAGFVCVCVILD